MRSLLTPFLFVAITSASMSSHAEEDDGAIAADQAEQSLLADSVLRAVTDEALQAAYGNVLSRHGPAYVAARDLLMNQDKTAVREFLRTKAEELESPVDRLWHDAFLTRLEDAARIDKALSDSIAEAEAYGQYPGRSGRPMGPSPNGAALGLLRRLGDYTLPLVTELLVKGIADEWEPWKREMLVMVMYHLGPVKLKSGMTLPARDPRAGDVLLWTLVHASGDDIARRASQYLPRFASQEVQDAVQAARAGLTSDLRRNLCDLALHSIEHHIQLKVRQATQPAGDITTSLPFKFSLAADRALSPQDRTEIDRLLAIAGDPLEPLASRQKAIALLGHQGAHQVCIDPLQALASDASRPEALREQAIVALSQIADKRVVPILIDQIDDESNAVRVTAMLRLKTITDAATSGPEYGVVHTREDAARCQATWERWWSAHKEDFVPDRNNAILWPG